MSIFVERGELSEVEAAPIGVDIMKYYNANQAAIRADHDPARPGAGSTTCSRCSPGCWPRWV